MNFKVSDISYFYVCNGEKTNDKFDNKIDFKTTLNTLSCRHFLD